MNYYPCDDTNKPLNYTPLILNPLALYQTKLFEYSYPKKVIKKKRKYKPFADYVPTSDLNNEELLMDYEMAEVIVIDIEPRKNIPELEGLEDAEVIVDPYEDL